MHASALEDVGQDLSSFVGPSVHAPSPHRPTVAPLLSCQFGVEISAAEARVRQRHLQQERLVLLERVLPGQLRALRVRDETWTWVETTCACPFFVLTRTHAILLNHSS